MQCRRGLAMRKLPVCPFVCLSDRSFVCLSNACIVTKGKKDVSGFFYHMKNHLAQFFKKNRWWEGRRLLPEMLGEPALVGAKSPIFIRYWLVAPQP